MPPLPLLRSPQVAPDATGGRPLQWQPEPARPTDVWDWLIGAAIVVGLVVLTHATLFSQVLRPLITDVESSSWGLFVERPSVMWTAMGTILLGVRTALWYRYRPAPAVTMEEAPALTVVIPAYNEGAMVATSIDSVAAAAYPRDRLEIVVVDDGSTDDTWEHIQRAAARHPGVVTTVRFPENRGKRAAPGGRLRAGARRDRGHHRLRQRDRAGRAPRHRGAVPRSQGRRGGGAGRRLQPRAGIIPRMLHVRFVLSFDLLRAAQSTYGTVYCCPGALSAYRTSIVRQILDEWMNQTFLGAPCTYGEDRALTNAIFGLGYDTVYQRTAVVHTVVPDDLPEALQDVPPLGPQLRPRGDPSSRASSGGARSARASSPSARRPSPTCATPSPTRAWRSSRRWSRATAGSSPAWRSPSA